MMKIEDASNKNELLILLTYKLIFLYVLLITIISDYFLFNFFFLLKYVL